MEVIEKDLRQINLVVKNQIEYLKSMQTEHNTLMSSLNTNELKEEIESIEGKLQSLEQKITGNIPIKKIDPNEKSKLEKEYAMNQRTNKERRAIVDNNISNNRF